MNERVDAVVVGAGLGGSARRSLWPVLVGTCWCSSTTRCRVATRRDSGAARSVST